MIALLPGSRQSELKHMADLFVQTAKLIHRQLKNAQFLVPLLSRETRRQFEDALYRNQRGGPAAYHPVRPCASGDDCGRLRAARVRHRGAGSRADQTPDGGHLQDALAHLCHRPRARSIVPYVSLPNILAGRFVVPEIFQDEATPEVLAQALVNQIDDKQVRLRQEREFRAIHDRLRQNTAERVVEARAAAAVVERTLLPSAADGWRACQEASA